MMELPPQVNRIIKEAKESPNKGNYTTYKHYKELLYPMGLTPDQYQEAVKRLAMVLKV